MNTNLIIQEEEERYNGKTTEIYDLIHDLNYKFVKYNGNNITEVRENSDWDIFLTYNGEYINIAEYFYPTLNGLSKTNLCFYIDGLNTQWFSPSNVPQDLINENLIEVEKIFSKEFMSFLNRNSSDNIICLNNYYEINNIMNQSECVVYFCFPTKDNFIQYFIFDFYIYEMLLYFNNSEIYYAPTTKYLSISKPPFIFTVKNLQKVGVNLTIEIRDAEIVDDNYYFIFKNHCDERTRVIFVYNPIYMLYDSISKEVYYNGKDHLVDANSEIYMKIKKSDIYVDKLLVTNINGLISINKIKIKEKNYDGIVQYDSNNKEWIIRVPPRPFQYSYVGFKAFKPVPRSGKDPNKIFYTCDLCNNSTKRVAFDYSNLTDGVEHSPLNQVQFLRFKIYDPKNKKYYSLSEVSEFYDHLELELEFISRK